MKAIRLTIYISCILSALTCSAKKYQIKVLNTPTITIDNREAKVGDWFDDQSAITWSRDNQAMRVVSEDNKVYTISGKQYKDRNSKKFADYILSTKPLATRGSKDQDLIEQLAERFDQDFVMLDEIVIDLSGIEVPDRTYFRFYLMLDEDNKQYLDDLPYENIIKIPRSFIIEAYDDVVNEKKVMVMLCCSDGKCEIISDSLTIIYSAENIE